MTKDSDFKQVVRARMSETGETYSAARQAIESQPPPAAAVEQTAYAAARIDQERLVAQLFTDGRLAQVPAKRKRRAGALLEVLTRFEPGRVYAEPEVNEVLLGVNEDFAYLRRELVDYHYLERTDGRYRVVGQVPTRSRVELLQEIPAWEAAWLPGFVLAADPDPKAARLADTSSPHGSRRWGHTSSQPKELP